MKMPTRVCLYGVALLALAVTACGQTKPLPETRNAALRYWMAFAEIKDPPSDKATQDLLEKTAAGEAAWDEAKLGPILDLNADAVAMFQRATKLPDCDWGIEYSRGPRASIAYVPRARVLARLNTLQGMREMAKGESQSAVDSWLAGIRFSEHLAKGGSLIFALVARSALLPNLRTLTAEARQGHLNAAQKRQILTILNALPEDGLDWARAWEMEDAAGEPLLHELRRSQNPGALYQSLAGSPAPKECMPPSTQDLQAYHKYMSDVAAALRQASPATNERLAQLDGERDAICEVIRNLIPSAKRVNDSRLQTAAGRKELLAALQTK